MGGGMGISQGASLRVVTERSKLAMPETGIGLFPDVGGGYFLSRLPWSHGRIPGADRSGDQRRGGRVAVDLADAHMDSGRLVGLWQSLGQTPYESGEAVQRWCENHTQKTPPRADAVAAGPRALIDAVFGLDSVAAIVSALEGASDDWSRETAATLRKRSPLMLHVVLEQIRRARSLGLADNLRLERGMVHHCFHLRPGAASETVEGIRALAIDKDHAPHWKPASIDQVRPAQVAAFFASPWAEADHPLRALH